MDQRLQMVDGAMNITILASDARLIDFGTLFNFGLNIKKN